MKTSIIIYVVMSSTSSSGAPQMGVSWVPKMRDHGRRVADGAVVVFDAEGVATRGTVINTNTNVQQRWRQKKRKKKVP